MKHIKILGADCANCRRLEAIAHKVVAQTGAPAEIEKITDYAEMMRWNILSIPALIIDDRLICAGRVPSEAEFAWLLQS